MNILLMTCNDSQYTNDIYKMISVGYSAQNVNGQYYFRPDDNMKYIDAVRVMLCMLVKRYVILVVILIIAYYC